MDSSGTPKWRSEWLAPAAPANNSSTMSRTLGLCACGLVEVASLGEHCWMVASDVTDSSGGVVVVSTVGVVDGPTADASCGEACGVAASWAGPADG